jgi:hypothetical protein
VEAKERARVIDDVIREAVDAEDVTALRALRAGLPAYLAAEWLGLVPRAQKKVADALLPLARGDATVAYVGKRVLGSATPHDRLAHAYALAETAPPTPPHFAPVARRGRVYGGA